MSVVFLCKTHGYGTACIEHHAVFSPHLLCFVNVAKGYIADIAVKAVNVDAVFASHHQPLGVVVECHL